MVVLLDLDDEGSDPHGHNPELSYASSKLHLNGILTREHTIRADKSLSTAVSDRSCDEDRSRTRQGRFNADHLFSRALACYPLAYPITVVPIIMTKLNRS